MRKNGWFFLTVLMVVFLYVAAWMVGADALAEDYYDYVTSAVWVADTADWQTGAIIMSEGFADSLWAPDYGPKRSLVGDDSLYYYLAGYDTTTVLDSIVCDSTYEQTLTNDKGEVFFVNLETDCDNYYSRHIKPYYEKKLAVYLTPDEYRRLLEILK